MSRRRKIFIIVGIVFGVAILLPVLRHYQLRFAVQSYIAELKAKGEPMELAQVIPPPVPPEQNGAQFITNALARLKSESIAGGNTPPAMRIVVPGKAIVGWQRPNIIGFNATNSWEDLDRELVAARSDLDSFQCLFKFPVLDFNLDYQNGFDLRLPNLSLLKRAAQWLGASALYNLHQGSPKNACADVRAILALVKGEIDERTLISQLVRIAITAIGVNATWEILQDPNVSDDDLAQLQQDWQSLEFTSPLEQSLQFERVENFQEFEQTRKSSEKFNKLWGCFYYAPETPVKENEFPRSMLTPRSIFIKKLDEIRWRWFWSYQDEFYGLQSYQVVIDAKRMAETNNSFKLAQSFADTKLTQLNLKQDSIDGLRGVFSANASAAALRKAIRIQTARNIVTTAIALKRYQLRHHQLPATLDQLTPDLLKMLPIDCMDGQPLRYRRNTDGTFLLYSVGENGVDDGGSPALENGVISSSYSWQNPHALDWVWPQTATAEEIQKYCEEQAKKSK
jgi:hypothetical protein